MEDSKDKGIEMLIDWADRCCLAAEIPDIPTSLSASFLTMAEVLLKFVSIKNENVDNKHNSIILSSTSTINEKSNISQTEKNSSSYTLPIISVTSTSDLPILNSISTARNAEDKIKYRLSPLKKKMSPDVVQTPKRSDCRKIARSNTFSVHPQSQTKPPTSYYRQAPIATTAFRPTTVNWRQIAATSPTRPPSTQYLYIISSSTPNGQITCTKPLTQRSPSTRHDEAHQYHETTYSDNFQSSSCIEHTYSSNQTMAQYGHFLAYLRQKSVARIKRKKKYSDTNSNNEQDIETPLINLKQQQQILQQKPKLSISTSLANNSSLLFSDFSVPIINTGKTSSTSIIEQRNNMKKTADKLPSTPWRLELRRSASSIIDTRYSISSNQIKPLNEMSNYLTINKDASLITPSNSIVDEPMSEKQEKKTHESCYELQLAGDSLSYVYVSDSGIKYEGELLQSNIA
ncbi:unnamed protein product [Didymodactylos carnosus]|uniref:Uncharacterized protein n=1 Tax=Didymodactylos carnosus TaxID=1234261 RepID=A0A814L435_9BILA|nr:unnamed protein product [Didymodactylos carnosus]CAF1059735.1 unnamed protein product [Didymodactylos carnosus]CAF3639376.1 unnamed protein product [Didymodactylos carnosus]CAF3828228.1 unnamed protein product [Didymodactylos carnosus]